MPPEDRVRRHDGHDLPPDTSAESATLRGEAAALVVGQSEAVPLQLSFEDAVLLHQVLDDELLLTIDESGERHEQQPQRGEARNHSPILPPPSTHTSGVYSWLISRTLRGCPVRIALAKS